ncbi:MAG: hypothetical protein ACLGHX_01630 [Acidimicrobiia bacterium]
MTVALFPADASEPLAAALAIAGQTPKLVDSISDPDSGAAGEWSVLVVELADEPMRRLRLVGELVAASGVPVLVVAEPAQFRWWNRPREWRISSQPRRTPPSWACVSAG